MFIRQYFKQENGRRTAYWALVESHRTATGPRQRVVAWLGKLDEAGRPGVKQAAEASRRSTRSTAAQNNTQPLNTQKRFEFDDDIAVAEPRWVEVHAGGVRVENLRQFGGPWLALHLIQTLQLDSFLEKVIPEGREHVPWDVSSLILIISRLLEPSSELFIAEQWYLLRRHRRLPAGTKRLFARSAQPLQTGVYRARGVPLRDAARLRGFRRKYSRCEDSREHRRNHGTPLREERSHLGHGSRYGQ